jgi:hypothetical protein
MSKGHVFLAQNSDVDYVRQAYALALSIKIHNTEHNQTCLITNDEVPDEYKHAFDTIIPIPWTDESQNSSWKIENRWKVFHATPFEENIVYDTDMLLLTSNDHWWNYLEKHDLYFTSNVRDYRGNVITDDYYRKSFTQNNLKNVYTGVYYFKKSTKTYQFVKWLETVVQNWSKFYLEHLKEHQQSFCSLDVSAALALKFMGSEDTYTSPNSILTFTHMKPAVQGWKNTPLKWTSVLSSYMTEECNLKIGNHLQLGLFHYVEEEFLEDDFILKLRNKYDR